MKLNEIDIYDFLKDYVDKTIIFIANPGNAGDYLITYSTILIFRKMKINFEFGNINNKYNKKILFYGGGGNLNHMYNDCRSFLNNNYKYNEIVILPHTINSNNDLLSKLDNNIKILCREIISYNYVSNILKNKENVFLCKDLAFYLEPEFLNSYYNTIGSGVFNAFRKDIESNYKGRVRNNDDLSLSVYKPNPNNDIKIFENVVKNFLFKISVYETINTDRLHIAIAGYLLNKKVNLYSNSYFKNKAVYEYSLKHSKNISFL